MGPAYEPERAQTRAIQDVPPGRRSRVSPSRKLLEVIEQVQILNLHKRLLGSLQGKTFLA